MASNIADEVGGHLKRHDGYRLINRAKERETRKTKGEAILDTTD